MLKVLAQLDPWLAKRTGAAGLPVVNTSGQLTTDAI